jgi:hypothetical protein
MPHTFCRLHPKDLKKGKVLKADSMQAYSAKLWSS